MLPTVALGPYQLTRLIVGGNPFRGNSHNTQQMSDDMREHYTAERMIATLLECERQGINTMQSRGDAIIMDMLRAYREQGGALQWIAQTATEVGDIEQNIRDIAALGAIAIYNHGSDTDQRWREGTMDVIGDRLKLIKDLGLQAGLGSHDPEVFYWAQEQDWPLDFYMACVYNLSKVERHSVFVTAKMVEEPFDDPDRELMCEFIRQTDKPCLAFKILGAARKCATGADVRAAFRFAFDHIKPTDAVVVGMFDKYLNQPQINARIVRELIGSEG